MFYVVYSCPYLILKLCYYFYIVSVFMNLKRFTTLYGQMGVITFMSIVLHCKLSAHQPNVHFTTLYFDHYFICHKVIFCGKMYHRETRLSIVNCINTLYSRVKPYRNELRYWSPSGQYCVGVHLGWVY